MCGVRSRAESLCLTRGKVTLFQSSELIHRHAEIHLHTQCLSVFLFSPKKAKAEQDRGPGLGEGEMGHRPSASVCVVVWPVIYSDQFRTGR